jgi:hypothetical protein
MCLESFGSCPMRIAARYIQRKEQIGHAVFFEKCVVLDYVTIEIKS